MPSGNFLIGDDLSLQAFNQYVKPLFEEKGYSVPDELYVPYEKGKIVLISLVGEGDLETALNEMLLESGEIIDEAQKERRQQGLDIQFPYVSSGSVSKFSHWEGEGEEKVRIDNGQYETLGTYQDDDRASQLFLLLAQGYLVADIGVKTKGIYTEFRKSAKRMLSNL